MTESNQSQMMSDLDPSQRLLESNESQQGLSESNQSKWAHCWATFVAYTIIIAGVTVFLCILIPCMIYYYTEYPPYASMEEFDAFALNKAGNTTNKYNHTITFVLRLHNMIKNKDKERYYGIYYDDLDLTYYYKRNSGLLVLIGNATFPAFYQGTFDDLGDHLGSIEPTGAFWEDATKAVSENGSAVFRVELATAYSYNVFFSKGRWFPMVVGADLHVNDHGKLVKSKIFHFGVELTSGASRSKGHFGLWGIVGLMLCFSFIIM